MSFLLSESLRPQRQSQLPMLRFYVLTLRLFLIILPIIELTMDDYPDVP